MTTKNDRPNERRPGPKGWPGRGGGRAGIISAPAEWRGTSVQVCGLWPFSVGTSAPLVGVPVGRHLTTGEPVCADPISWFQQAHLINNPSAMFLALPGLGKSTVCRRMLIGLAAMGSLPMVFGDLRPDYVDVGRQLGAQVVKLGHGHGSLNPLDATEAHEAAALLRGEAREAVLGDSLARRVTMVESLITIARRNGPTDREMNIIAAAIELFDRRRITDPLLSDLLELIRSRPDELSAAALDRGNPERYSTITEELEASLMGLVGSGKFGRVFSRPTTEPLRRDRAAVFDVSSIPDSDASMQAAVLLACWSAGFGTINVANELAGAGLEPQRNYVVVLDELHRGLRAGPGMVDRVDTLTRLNRKLGVGMIFITHTMKDLDSLPTPEDRAKARGFIERAGMLVLGGLPPAEMPDLTQVVRLSRVEQELLASWADPAPYDPHTDTEAEPPGRGKFLVKVGTRPGIPTEVKLIEQEFDINDTNRRWHAGSRIGLRDFAGSVPSDG